MLDTLNFSSIDRAKMPATEANPKLKNPSKKENLFAKLLDEKSETQSVPAENTDFSLLAILGMQINSLQQTGSEQRGATSEIQSAKTLELPTLKMNDSAMNLVKAYTEGDVDIFAAKDDEMIARLAKLAEAMQQQAQTETENLIPAELITRGKETAEINKNQPLISNGAQGQMRIDPKVYASLMEKANGFVEQLKGLASNAGLSEILPQELVAKFDKVAEAMNLNSAEKKLFGQAIAFAFMGAVNEQDGIQRLVGLLDASEISGAFKKGKLYSNGPLVVNAKEVSQNESHKSSTDLKARDNIAKLSFIGKSQETREALKDPNSDISTNNSEIVDFSKVLKNEAGKLQAKGEQLDLGQQSTKVSEHRIDSKNIVEELGSKLNFSANNKGGEMKIKLHPDNLGELLVQVKTNSNNNVEVKIVTSTPEAKTLLESSLSQLRDTLGSQNLNLTKVNIESNLGNLSKDASQFAFNSTAHHDQGKHEFSKSESSFFEKQFGTNVLDGKSTIPTATRYGNRYNYVA